MQTTHELLQHVMMLGDLMARIASGRVRAGRFTWPERMTDAETTAVLQSVRLGFPMGALTLWSTTEDHEGPRDRDALSNAPRPDGLVMYVVDGGARAHALARALLPQPDDEDDGRRNRRAYIDPKTDIVSVRRPADAHDDLLPLDRVLDTARYLTWAMNPDRGAAAAESGDRIAAAFRDYQVMMAEMTNCDRAIIDVIRERTILRA